MLLKHYTSERCTSNDTAMSAMSFYCGKLCSLILAEHFGSIIQTIGDYLFKNGSQTLSFIRSTTGLPVLKVKESLCVLIKHGLVVHEQTEKGMTYTIQPDRIIMILRYSRYMFFVKSCCGDECEMILEEILRNGCETASAAIVRTCQRLGHANSTAATLLPQMKEKFELLAKNQFVMRSLSTPTTAEVSTDKPDYDVPDLNVKAMSKILAGEIDDTGDENIYWRVNFDRLTQDLRDQILVHATTRILDDNAGELMRQLLFLMYIRTASWANTSNPIPFTEIKDSVKKLNIPSLYQYVDQYLRLIEEDSSKFLKRVGDSGGGQFSVNMEEAFAQLAWATVENIVMERFGSKAARIFRLVRSRNFIEQEQIQQLAMIPAKEAKHLTYKLLQENYLQMQEIKKTGIAAAPSKAFFLFHIDLNQVVRMEIEHCYHALYNIMYRREHEAAANRRMIDKQMRMHTLTSNLKEHGATEEQLAEIAEMMTPSEKQQLDKVQTVIKKLGGGELQTEGTLFLLNMYLRYH